MTAKSDKTIICSHCGNQASRYRSRRGLCNACVQYKRRHGVDRPLTDTVKCRNAHCDRMVGFISAMRGRWLCKRCRQYRALTGRDWTPDVARPRRNGQRPLCAVCRERIATRTKPAEICNCCYNYWRRNKKRRPRWLDAEYCRNCHRPRSREPRQFIRGRCKCCYEYFLRTGQERPRRLWGVGELGWCDCGAPANHEISVVVRQHTEKLRLCDDCYAEEMRQRSIYGEPK